MPCTVFADGFMLYRGPFRPYAGAPSNIVFTQQVMAGYLPHELQQRYPAGFGFELHNECGRTHSDAHAEAIAQHAARSRAAGGGGGGGSGSGGGARGVAGISDLQGGAASLLAPQQADAMLRRLPASVMRDGAVLPVRAEVSELLGRGGGNATAAAHASAPSAAEGGMEEQQRLDAVRAARLRRFGQ